MLIQPVGEAPRRAAQLAAVVNAVLAVGSGLARHVLVYRTVTEATAQGEGGRQGIGMGGLHGAGGNLGVVRGGGHDLEPSDEIGEIGEVADHEQLRVARHRQVRLHDDPADPVKRVVQFEYMGGS